MSMSSATAVCALDDCDNPIPDDAAGAARRYCCAAHRKVARKHRRGPESLAEPVTVQQPAAGMSHDPPTEPIPIARASPEPDASARRVVPAPKPRWFRRTSQPFAARGVKQSRLRPSPPPLPTQPEWLRPATGESEVEQPAALMQPVARPAPARPKSRPSRAEPAASPCSPPPSRIPAAEPADAAPPVAESIAIEPEAPVVEPASVEPVDEVDAPEIVEQTAVEETEEAETVEPADAPESPESLEEFEPADPVEPESVEPELAEAVEAADTPVQAEPTVSPVSSEQSEEFEPVDVVPRVGSAPVEEQRVDHQPATSTEQWTAPSIDFLQELTAPPAPAPRRSKKAAAKAAKREKLEQHAEAKRKPAKPDTSRSKRREAKPANQKLPEAFAKVAWLGQMREALYAALHSLSSNRLRSFLTTVGIIAGVASVIVLVAMGDGMKKGFNDQWSRFATQITIAPITGPVATGKAPQHLTDADLKALQNRRKTPDVVTLSPAVASNSVTLAYGQKKSGAQLFGIVQNYLDLANRFMVAGNWFTEKQMSATVRQAVIGPQVVNALWGPSTDPNTVIGLTLRVGHSSFQIQGVVNSDGQNDNVVMVPLEAARAYVVGNNGDKLDIIIARASSTATVQTAKSQIFQVMYEQHHVREDTDRDFNVTDYTNLLQQQMSSIKFMSLFIIAVAGISLFVGGVGVANIMLVAVTERTREIGIRKAIGAPRRAIMRQFLSEAVMLTTLGGVVGVILGVGLCKLGEVVIPKLWPPDPASLTPTPLPLLSFSPVLIAFAVSVVIGLLAGGYPAYRASRLRPIEALRFE